MVASALRPFEGKGPGTAVLAHLGAALGQDRGQLVSSMSLRVGARLVAR